MAASADMLCSITDFLTVYPDDGMANVTDADLVALGTQIKSYQDAGRTVWLRYAPEMFVYKLLIVLSGLLTIFA